MKRRTNDRTNERTHTLQAEVGETYFVGWSATRLWRLESMRTTSLTPSGSSAGVAQTTELPSLTFHPERATGCWWVEGKAG